MTPLLLSLALLLQAPAYRCKIDDAPCWADAALTQQERAERAEGRVKLLTEAREIGDRLLAEADARGDRWKNLAEQVAPKTPMFYEQPTFWIVVGFVAGAATAVAVTYAVNR